MSDEPSVENRPTSVTPATSPAPSLDPAILERNNQIHSAIAICSLALMGCFFLPWVEVFLGQTASGYDLQQLPSNGAKLVWIIPAGGLLAFIAALARLGAASASQLAGAFPFLTLLYYCIELGHELFDDLRIGAYLTLLVGAVLFVLPRFLKKPQP